jgi:quinol-cytochrome oxidoreductase complex cytochrome b subunit
MDRDEEDIEVNYIDDFFWLHERGVDFIFIFSYLHLFRKLYVNAYDIDQETSWKSGVFTFLIFQVVTFFGLLLCATHLSEITLTIAANVFHTFFGFYGKFYWWLFTDKTLNTDTLIRLGYLHYITAFYMAYAATTHGIDLHYDWKNKLTYDGVETELAWWDEALGNELSMFLYIVLLFIMLCFVLYPEPEALSYELFMWGDIGFITDVRFYGVAPHWYFRPFMAWLIVCPYHKTGIFGLIFFFFVLFHQPTINGDRQEPNVILFKTTVGKNGLYENMQPRYTTVKFSNLDCDYHLKYSYVTFIMAILYTGSYLPYGRFYNRLNGNLATLFAYFYVFIFLSFSHARKVNFFKSLNLLFF